MQAYKKYVTMILTRVNTITNVTYSQDPTIFALELANEPHTTDNYEKDHNMQPGSLIKGWIKEVVAHIRTLDKNHMVSTHRGLSAHAAPKGLWALKEQLHLEPQSPLYRAANIERAARACMHAGIKASTPEA
jgi:endo-1,4-beta-mannosidase